ncbi:hypothetical protein GQ53DRAFT_849489 [Thozetella sp. PMI_491]|nr:hypothetical protein GQ53DRAFT_849489 [Thozetella sp. PMI_491]
MDDLSSLDWSATSTSSSNPPKPTQTQPMSSSFYPALRPTPSPFTSGRNTPLSTQGSGTASFKPPGAAAKGSQDSFSNLVNFGAAKSTANLSLRERQELLEAEKRKKEEEKRKKTQAQYGDGQFLDSLGQRQQSQSTSRVASPAISLPISPPPATQARNGKPAESDDDLFAAFNANTKVDNASHYPPPPASGKASPANAAGLDLRNPNAWSQPAPSSNGDLGNDDDPFGLNQFTAKPPARQDTFDADEDDDLLGDLGKPVEQVRRERPQPAPRVSRDPEPGKALEDYSSDSEPEPVSRSNDPFDKAVAQLVDYGFTPEKARMGLTESGAGLNVQAAVNWLLDDAHREAKEKAKGKSSGDRPGVDEDRSSSRPRNGGGAAWMREDARPEPPGRRDNRSPASGDDFTKTATAMGNNFLKTANSLWKTGKKNVQKAMADFQQEGGDPNQPKWMRSAQQDGMAPGGGRSVDVTDEAMMLESGARPERGPQRLARETPPSSHTSSRSHSPALGGQSRGAPAPKWQQASQSSLLDPRSRLSKQATEEQSAQAYVSPARRKKATPQPQPEPEPDLLFNSQAPRTQQSLPSRPAQPSPPAQAQAPPKQAPRALPPRPARQIPSISPVALQTSNKHRQDGTAHFKRGDYAAAHSSYSSSLAAVPNTHPIAIVILCNRALTAIKTGEPRQAVEDADTAISIIGPGKGEGEHVELQDGEGEKRDMKDLYGKALSRKAEALEQMEKWGEAGSVWQLCVEAGVGGSAALAGRQRCQKALAPKPAVKPAAPKPRPRPAALATQKSSEAVQRLREANKAAEAEGDEKFALTDKVDARIAAWRDGKRDNLRALIGSLENVLWESSGWKKVGLHELVVANRVKIHYMKAIAKTHPDKLPQDANTEVRMIAGTVFSTLNEAWDKFKAENGL